MDNLNVKDIVPFALAVIPWLFPDLSFCNKVILTLCIVIISLLVYCSKLAKTARSAEESHRETESRHKALATQFDQKTRELNRYKSAFSDLGLMLHLAMQNTKQAKFEDIYRAFLIAQKELIDGGNGDGQ